jgi:exodeoxyribonuclease III
MQDVRRPFEPNGIRILSWNIRHGGGSRLPRIVDAISAYQPDVIILCEFRLSGDAFLRKALFQHGYESVARGGCPRKCNGVVIASKLPLKRKRVLSRRVEDPHRMVVAEFEDLHVVGVYMPNLLRKTPYWDAVLRSARHFKSRPTLLIGDFNTTRHFVDEPGQVCKTSPYMDLIEAAGFRDLWRHRNPEAREYSWYSHRGNGYRLDHAFFSASLADRVQEVWYSHAERQAGLSDHSIILADISRSDALPIRGRTSTRRPCEEIMQYI